jgi:hypothetical protein
MIGIIARGTGEDGIYESCALAKARTGRGRRTNVVRPGADGGGEMAKFFYRATERLRDPSIQIIRR